MDVVSTGYKLYPEIQPYETGFMEVDGIHKIYWETSGNPSGIPVLFIHGGPGAGASSSHRRFFDPDHYRIIVLDQRGSGRSLPFAEIRENTTQDLILDLERLRKLLSIKKWLLFGGSWGSSLALAYGIQYPERVKGFILRGIFLCRTKELEWFLKGMAIVFPEFWRKFNNFLPPNERDNLLDSYYKRLINPDPFVHVQAAAAWVAYESSCSTLLPNKKNSSDPVFGKSVLALARIEAHYFVNKMFLPDNYFFEHLRNIRSIPSYIIQGRYDMVCPISTADELSTLWPEANYQIISNAGHSAMEPDIKSALVAAAEQFKNHDLK